MITGMTTKQKDALNFIEAYMATERASPSFEEMKVGLGLKSKSGVHRLIHGLIERGHIELLPGRKRAIRLAGHKALAMFSLDELEAEVERRKSGSDTLSILRAV